MLELIKESDLDTVRHFYRALAGTEFCAGDRRAGFDR